MPDSDWTVYRLWESFIDNLLHTQRSKINPDRLSRTAKKLSLKLDAVSKTATYEDLADTHDDQRCSFNPRECF